MGEHKMRWYVVKAIAGKEKKAKEKSNSVYYYIYSNYFVSSLNLCL